MITYENFIDRYYGSKREWRAFSPEERQTLGKQVPEGVLQFLEREGLSSYGENFLWTTLPDDHRESLSDWGLKGQQAQAFLRTAFGALIFYYREKFHYLDPLQGRRVEMTGDFYLLLNYMLNLDAILEPAFFIDQFQAHKEQAARLQPDEVLAFAPALPLGGTFETASVEIVKMREHLALLAQLFDNKATKID